MSFSENSEFLNTQENFIIQTGHFQNLDTCRIQKGEFQDKEISKA